MPIYEAFVYKGFSSWFLEATSWGWCIADDELLWSSLSDMLFKADP